MNNDNNIDGLQLLEPGDIAFVSGAPFKPKQFKFKDKLYLPKLPTLDTTNSEAYLRHTWGFREGQYSCAHAVNTGLSCVTIHELGAVYKKNQRIGSTVILHCSDDKLKREIHRAMCNSANRYTEEEVKMIKESKKGVPIIGLKSPYTPYAEFREKDKDVSRKIVQMKYLVRSFRAYYLSEDARPLSKEKGLSCRMFMDYCIKIGLINLFLINNFSKILNR